MKYINTTTKQTYTEQELRLLFSNTSFPTPFIAPDGYEVVFPAPQREHNPVTQRVREVQPVLTPKGHWEEQWEVIELFDTQAEKDYAIAADLEAKRLASVPASVTMRQARLALRSAGLLESINATLASLPSPQKEDAEIEWEYSQEVQRHNGFIPVVAAALGMTDKQIDDLFIAASLL